MVYYKICMIYTLGEFVHYYLDNVLNPPVK